MTGELDHLHPPFRTIAAKSADERIDWIRQDRWIHYLRADQALKQFDQLLAHPPRTRMPCLLLTGAPGMGKTHIVQKFVRDNPPVFDDMQGTTRVPVVAMQMPPEPLEQDFCEEFLMALGAVISTGLSVVSLRVRARKFARQFGVRLLIIDEIHSMLAGTFRQQRRFLNSLRFLANDLHLPIVCVGIGEAYQALTTDQQLADRFGEFELPPWCNDASFAQLLKTFGTMFPLRAASDLCDPKIRQRILALTEGITVRICRVLEVAAIAAIRDGSETITLDSFKGSETAAGLVSIADRQRRRGAA
jgi:Bacterial TniB protein